MSEPIIYNGKIYERITVDVSQPNAFAPPLVKEGDSGTRGYIVTVTDHGEKITIPTENTVVWFNCRNKTDPTRKASSNGTINDDGTVTVDVPTVVMDTAGYIECDISIITTEAGETSILKTMLFCLSCEPAANKSGTSTQAEDNILAELAAGTIAPPGAAYVPKTRTIADIDLQDDITAAELQTALGVDDKMALLPVVTAVIGWVPDYTSSVFKALSINQLFRTTNNFLWVKTSENSAAQLGTVQFRVTGYCVVNGPNDMYPNINDATDSTILYKVLSSNYGAERGYLIHFSSSEANAGNRHYRKIQYWLDEKGALKFRTREYYDSSESIPAWGAWVSFATQKTVTVHFSSVSWQAAYQAQSHDRTGEFANVNANDFVFNASEGVLYICTLVDTSSVTARVDLVPIDSRLGVAEVTTSKASAISESNKNSTDQYTSVKAVADYVDGIVGDIETLLSQI